MQSKFLEPGESNVPNVASVPVTVSDDRQRGELRALVLFFIATFALAWTLWLLAAAVMPSSGRNALFFLPGTVAPALVALWLNARAPGPARLLDRMFLWDVGVRWFLFAASYMALIKLVAAASHRLFVGDWPTFGSVPLYLMLLATFASTPVQAGEEIGWRGYALPRLASAMGLPAASIVLGVIWALWHLPLFIISGTDSTGQPFVIFLLAVTAVSVAMTWLYVRTGASLLLVMLMHAAINNTTGIVPSARAEPGNPFDPGAPLMAWLTTAVLWITAAYFLIRLTCVRPSDASLGGTA